MANDTELLSLAVTGIVAGAIFCVCQMRNERLFSHLDERSWYLIPHSVEDMIREVDFVVGTVGLANHSRAVVKMLDMHGNGPAKAVIIYGPAGSGKSTLAQYVLRILRLTLYLRRRGSPELVTVNMERTDDTTTLQAQIYHAVTGEDVHFRDSAGGQAWLAPALKRRPCILFLDNVLDRDRVKRLLPQVLSLPSDSRLLITARDDDVREVLGIECQQYRMGGLANEAAKQLLRQTVFGNDENRTSPDDEPQIAAIAEACAGIPLVLKLVGRYLAVHCTDPAAYIKALKSLEEGKRGHYNQEEVTKKAFKSLVFDDLKDEDAKDAFLDICVYFQGWKQDIVSSIVGESELATLREGELLKINESDGVIVPDDLRRMGMEEDKSARLKGIHNLLSTVDPDGGAKEQTGRKGVWLHDVGASHDTFNLECEHMDAMSGSLRVLSLGDLHMLGDWINLKDQCQGIFRNLRFLHIGDIHPFPFRNASHLEKLKVLSSRSMACMDLVKVPEALTHFTLTAPLDFTVPVLPRNWQNIANLTHLRKFELQNFEFVEKFPAEFLFPESLIDLYLTGCKRLHTLPQGLHTLTRLQRLSLQGCRGLNILPEEFGTLSSLQWLSLQECESLTELPQQFGMLTSLTHLSCDGCKMLTCLPDEFGKLSSLRWLSMKECENLQQLPESFRLLDSLERLDLFGCISLKRLPENMGSLSRLRQLILKDCKKLENLPESLGRLSGLQELIISGCSRLERLPRQFGQFSSLRSLDLGGLESLIELPAPRDRYRRHLTDLQLEDCNSLKNIPIGFEKWNSLERLCITRCNQLLDFPEDFCKLRSLRYISLWSCTSLKGLPESFHMLPNLQELFIEDCGSLSSLPNEFGHLNLLKRLEITNCDGLEKLSDEFGQLKSLEILRLSSCRKLETLSNDFESLASLRELSLVVCNKLQSKWMEKVVKLENLIFVDIENSGQLIKRWDEMEENIEDYPFVVTTSDTDKRMPKYGELIWRAISCELLQNKCTLVDREGALMCPNNCGKRAFFIVRRRYSLDRLKSDLLHDIQERVRAENSEIVFVETEPQWGYRNYDEKRIRQNLGRLPGARSISSEDIKIRSLFSHIMDHQYSFKCVLIIADLVEDTNGRKRFQRTDISIDFRENTIQPDDDSHQREENKFQDYISGRYDCIYKDATITISDFTKALETNGIQTFVANDGSKVGLDALEGKMVLLFLCDYHTTEFSKFQQAYKNFQGANSGLEVIRTYKYFLGASSDFKVIWSPVKEGVYGFGSFVRATKDMPWLTLPDRTFFNDINESRLIVFDKRGYIVHKDAMQFMLRWGASAFPFTEERIENLRRKELRELQKSQSSFQFLLGETIDCLISGEGTRKKQSPKGKVILLFGGFPQGLYEWKLSCVCSKHKDIENFKIVYVGDADLSYDNLRKQEEMHERVEKEMPFLTTFKSLQDMITFWCRYRWMRDEHNSYLAKEVPDKWTKLKGLLDRLQNGISYSPMWFVLLDGDGEVVTGRGKQLVELLWRNDGDGTENEEMRKDVIQSLQQGKCSERMKERFSDENIHPK